MVIKMEEMKVIPLREISEITDIPFEILKWHINNKNSEEIKKDVDYVISGRSVFLTITGVLWLFQKTNYQNFSKQASVLEKFFAEEYTANDILNELQNIVTKYTDKHSNSEENKESFESEIDLDTINTNEENKKEENKKNEIQKKWAKSDYDRLPELTDEEQRWSAKVHAMINNYIRQGAKKENFCTIVNRVYRKMNSVYGIVWEQCKKDFITLNGLDEDVKITNYRLICYDSKLRSLFEAILKDFIQ